MPSNKHSSLTTVRRRTAQRAGERGEHVAALWLRSKGYRILKRRYRVPMGEIDLIARRGSIVAFVEVKTRRLATASAGSEWVSAHQWHRVGRAAGLFLGRYADASGQALVLSARFDLMIIQPWRLPRHVRDVWRPS